MSHVQINNVVKQFGDFTALHELNLDIVEGEFLTLLGPSGCGKTTTLRLIAGFIQPTKGTILLGDQDVTGVAPQHREIGMVFQDYALFPHMTISENIAFGLQERKYEKAKIQSRVRELLELIRLPDAGDRYPSEVSGGQQQRIAVARAVAYPPRVLLMDEPLGALDLKLREAMQFELRRIQQELKITTVYVTHDQTEAMNMSDRIVVMNHGLIEQLGGAEDIYNHPKTRFVADFVGTINLLDATVVEDDGDWQVANVLTHRIKIPRHPDVSNQATISIGVRPELARALPANADSDGMNAINGEIKGKTFAGNLMKTFVAIGDGMDLVIESRPNEWSGEPGEQIKVVWEPKDAIVLTS